MDADPNFREHGQTQNGSRLPVSGLGPRVWARCAATALGLLLALVAYEVIGIVISHRSPSEGDWQRAARKIKDEATRHKEPILIAPRWVAPLARLYLGDSLNLKLATLSHIENYPRVWQISIRDRLHPWLAGLKAQDVTEFGGVSVSRYDRVPARILVDLVERLTNPTGSALRIERGVNRGTEPDLIAAKRDCPKRGTRYICDERDRSLWVGAHIAEVDFKPYRCIYAHPVANESIILTFDDIEFGRTLVGFSGIDDVQQRKRAARFTPNSRVRLAIFVGNKEIAEVVDGKPDHWSRFSIDTRAFQGKKEALRFEISAPQPKYQPFCFYAETRS